MTTPVNRLGSRRERNKIGPKVRIGDAEDAIEAIVVAIDQIREWAQPLRPGVPLIPWFGRKRGDAE